MATVKELPPGAYPGKTGVRMSAATFAEINEMANKLQANMGGAMVAIYLFGKGDLGLGEGALASGSDGNSMFYVSGQDLHFAPLAPDNLYNQADLVQDAPSVAPSV
jgi:hypothetical protein